MKNRNLFQKTTAILCSFVAFFALTTVSCGLLWKDDQNSRLIVSLPTSGSRSIESEELEEIKNMWGSWAVSVAVKNGPTYRQSGEGTFSFDALPVGQTVTVRVECLGEDGEILAYAEKTLVMAIGPNVVSINMAKDGISIAALEREKYNGSNESEVTDSRLEEISEDENNSQPQEADTEEGVLYVTKNGNDTTGDGSNAKPYSTLAKAVTMANQSVKDNVTIHVKDTLSNQSTGNVSDGGTLQSGKTYTIRADNKDITVDIGNGITAGNGVTLNLENITLTGSGSLTYVVGVEGGTVSLNNAYILHTESAATNISTANNSAVTYTSGTLSMQGDSRITKVNMSEEDDLQVSVPAAITASENTILFATLLYSGLTILTGSGVSTSNNKFTVGYASIRSAWTVDSDGTVTNN